MSCIAQQQGTFCFQEDNFRLLFGNVATKRENGSPNFTLSFMGSFNTNYMATIVGM